MKDKSFNFPLWDRQIFYKQKTNLIDLFLFANKIVSYKIEGKSIGIGPVQTENILYNFVLQVIPQAWYKMRLAPSVKEANLIMLNPSSGIETNTYFGQGVGGEGDVYAIPTSYSRNWQLTVDGKREKNSVLVNGWGQGWIVDKKGEMNVSFTVNTLLYMGLLPIAAITVFIVGKTMFSFVRNGR